MQTQSSVFPPLESAGAEGLLAVGGDLSVWRLLAAYRGGIFPWYGPGEPILWWSPDPRCVIFPQDFRAARSLRRALRRAGFHFTLDAAFAQVIKECAAPRAAKTGAEISERAAGSWITAEMARAYTKLHRAGFAHSAEVWRRGELVGGLYGVALGGVFFGESMFSRADNASKAALAWLVEKLIAWDFRLIDCQISSPHLLRLGAVEIPRAEFMRRLQAALSLRGRGGRWDDINIGGGGGVINSDGGVNAGGDGEIVNGDGDINTGDGGVINSDSVINTDGGVNTGGDGEIVNSGGVINSDTTAAAETIK